MNPATIRAPAQGGARPHDRHPKAERIQTMKPRSSERDSIIVAAAVVALAAVAYVVGIHVERSGLATPQTKLERAREALRAGDDSVAFSTFEPLAKAGNARAQFWLGDMYEHGYGTKKDASAAIDWLTRAAKQGLTRAEARLGRIYLEGDVTPQDFATAKRWLSAAAMQGDAGSERYVGHIYELGLGVPRDPVAAYAWYECAVLNGDRFAVRLRDALTGRMQPDQIAKAEGQAKDLWREIRPAA
ncbi:MAG TPA: tetratricopeptide repeat protein [Methylomirabilota bacterium]|nr:tetratricopeptide repeat protein [Methylomirabilota bacterium]